MAGGQVRAPARQRGDARTHQARRRARRDRARVATRTRRVSQSACARVALPLMCARACGLEVLRMIDLDPKRYDTDKLAHARYLQNYEAHFKPLAEQALSLLELSVKHGGSLLCWRHSCELSYLQATTLPA